MGGIPFLIENPTRGGGVPGGGGTDGVGIGSAVHWGIWGGRGGAKYCFSGPTRPPSSIA